MGGVRLVPEQSSTLRSAVGWALPLQVSWAILSSIWNIAGVLLISQGLRAPGPTASWLAALVLLVIAAVLMWAVKRSAFLYLLLSLLMGVGAFYSVMIALTADPSLWPSPFWHWVGAVLNSAGTLGAIAAAVYFLRWKAKQVNG